MPNLLPIPLLVALAALSGCDQLSPSRYEVTKDQSGRTLRLDKRTGEVAVIEGERISPIRDSKTVDTERERRANDLARAKSYPVIALQQFGLEASLRTSWQDDKLLYAVTFGPIDKMGAKKDGATATSAANALKPVTKPANPDWTKFKRHTWTLILEDTPFELAQTKLSFARMVDENEKTLGHEAKGGIAMSSETYKRIDVWNVMWRPIF